MKPNPLNPNCIRCGHLTAKNGRSRWGKQMFRCKKCGKQFCLDPKPNPRVYANSTERIHQLEREQNAIKAMTENGL